MRYKTINLHNVCDIIEGDGNPGVGLSRLPVDILENINKGARNMARMGTGCEIRGMSPEDGEAKVVLQVVDDNVTPPVATVYHGCFCGQSVYLSDVPTTITITPPKNLPLMEAISRLDHHPFDPRLIRIRLPHIHTTRILSIEGDLGYPPAAATPAKTLLCYGSSITHGASAIPPEGMYAAHCARRLGYDVINLGFGGAAQMDAAIAEHIAARTDWDIATLEMGINVRDWPLETFRQAVERFVGTIATAHPDKYLFCIDLFTNDADFMDNPAKGAGFREAVADSVSAFDSGKIVHVDGRTILTDPTGLRTDLVHPSDLGMAEMGTNLAHVIQQYVNL
ncbi:MAG: SGNH/GDSL hydrolase family protein [Lentisphaeria bacterium]|nr:SGNH/GDSL hydrolase family protein [Lentisphaeria bacterium]